ncbi:HD domain-containing protein [Ammonifex thiophilus]|uniref:HD domain-containing protein n=1 Tax=Ammonifex thiophilus TaxID=444093 RepID=A0A3D8P340_9THEO|nr:HD domain-containing protein [Ammonifex thiophilus]RDV82992.1 HD domain-containing protein [Ammonifex thiophilus]
MQRREVKVVTLQDVKRNPVVETFIRKGNQFLGEMGYTEHSFRHVNLVATIARNILERLNYPPREAELAAIAGYLHDIGNVVSRNDHGISGALIAYRILSDMGMPPEELAIVISAIANHEEQYGQPVNNVAAALILADKSDVHRSRVRNPDPATFDIHDRVNYAVEHSFLWVNEEKRTITLELTIDIQICPVMEYFEIFLSRMALCRRAAKFLKADFELMINGAKLL